MKELFSSSFSFFRPRHKQSFLDIIMVIANQRINLFSFEFKFKV